VFMMTMLKLDANDADSHQVMLRGVTPPAFLVHPQARIIDGHAPEPGKDELLVGSSSRQDGRAGVAGSGRADARVRRPPVDHQRRVRSARHGDGGGDLDAAQRPPDRREA
jgi:hypothetical protein